MSYELFYNDAFQIHTKVVRLHGPTTYIQLSTSALSYFIYSTACSHPDYFEINFKHLFIYCMGWGYGSSHVILPSMCEAMCSIPSITQHTHINFSDTIL
jgi:hypothetical protein